MRKFRINSASISPSQYDSETDEEFVQELSSLITLEDGSSLNLKKAVLLYNPKTRKIQLTDSESVPEDFIQLATLNLTSEKPEVTVDEPFQELPEIGEEGEEEGEENSEDGSEEGEPDIGDDINPGPIKRPNPRPSGEGTDDGKFFV